MCYLIIEPQKKSLHWFGKKNYENIAPILLFIKEVNEECSKIIQQFETSMERESLDEAVICEQFVRWSLSNHLFSTIMQSILQSSKHISKYFTKNSLLASQSFKDEFVCVLDLLEQIQF